MAKTQLTAEERAAAPGITFSDGARLVAFSTVALGSPTRAMMALVCAGYAAQKQIERTAALGAGDGAECLAIVGEAKALVDAEYEKRPLDPEVVKYAEERGLTNYAEARAQIEAAAKGEA